jgi:hypothetical protein
MKQYVEHRVEKLLGSSELLELNKTVGVVQGRQEFATDKENVWELRPEHLQEFPTLEKIADDIQLKLESLSEFRGLKLEKVWVVLTEPAVADQTKLPYIPHFDKRRYLKGMVYLHDVEIENGPIHFGKYQESFRVDEIRRTLPENHKELGLNLVADQNMSETPSPVLGAAGDLVMFDTNAPHKAGTVAEGHFRKVVRFDFEHKDFHSASVLSLILKKLVGR